MGGLPRSWGKLDRVVVSLAAVLSVVTQERCVTTLRTAAMETNRVGDWNFSQKHEKCFDFPVRRHRLLENVGSPTGFG